MAKLAQQIIILQVSKAVSDDGSDTLAVVDSEALSQIQAVTEALIDGSGAIVEITNG